MSAKVTAKLDEAIQAIKKGRMVILVDDKDRENEGDLVIAAEKITPDAINFMITHARGLVCLPMANELIDRLKIPMMTTQNQSTFQTGFTVSISAAKGITTGISPKDRATTIRAAVANESQPSDIYMPGHIFPLREKKGGLEKRQGHTEGSIALARMAGLTPAAVICEIINPDGEMARQIDLEVFAEKHRLPLLSISDLPT